MKKPPKKPRTLRRPLSNAERQAEWRKRHPARHRKQQQRAYRRRRGRELAAEQAQRLEQELQHRAEIERRNQELQRKRSAQHLSAEDIAFLRATYDAEFLQVAFPGLGLTPSAAVEPAVTIMPGEEDPEKEFQQLLANELRMDRLRAEAQERSTAERLMRAAAMRGQY